MKINTKQIGKFLKSLEGADFIYLKHCVELRSSIAHLINDHQLTQEQVCEHFNIKANKYEDFVKGNWDYSIRDLGAINALYMELELKRLEKTVPVQVPK